MIRAIVQCSEWVTLVGGGHISGRALETALALAPMLAAADGGADRALALGHRPRHVIGDLDSLGELARATLAPEALHEVSEQETTDFEKCLARIDAPLVLALGFSAPRLDHALVVLGALPRHPGTPCIVLGAADLAFAAPPRRSLALDLAAGTRVSLFPMAPVTGRSEGLQWPIEGIDFAPAGRAGSSNRALGPVRLEFDAAGMLVILPKASLAAAAKAIARPAPGTARGG